MQSGNDFGVDHSRYGCLKLYDQQVLPGHPCQVLVSIGGRRGGAKGRRLAYRRQAAEGEGYRPFPATREGDTAGQLA